MPFGSSQKCMDRYILLMMSLWMLALLLTTARGVGVISKMQAEYNKLRRSKNLVLIKIHTGEQLNHKKLQKIGIKQIIRHQSKYKEILTWHCPEKAMHDYHNVMSPE